MPTRRSRLVLLAVAALAPATGALAATLAHDYTLQGTYADSLGGPSLIPAGGTLSPTGYTFGPNQGFTVASALPNPASYSILLDFQFASVTGYRRIIEFKNHGADTGLYVLSNHLNFYNIVTSSTDSFVANTQYRVVLTRDATTNVVSAYLNGTRSLTFTDNNGLAIFSAASNIAHFFIDDNAVPNEASAGFVNRIAIYDAPLSAADVSLLGDATDRLPGDANLNGKIDPDDFALLDRGFAKHLTGWSNGDFNSDGVVNQNDYLLIDTSYGQAQGFAPGFLAQRESQFGPAYASALLQSVPEPASVILPLLALPLAARRRTR